MHLYEEDLITLFPDDLWRQKCKQQFYAFWHCRETIRQVEQGMVLVYYMKMMEQ